ncbi:MAG: AAA family ATPase [Novosphingobium sp.]|uniref:AAA family ATPase n=1 Tax=Novosphingobium sp. TaxID=1874826 RepID=UPI002601B6B5|nr:AAA family ATPase [Novosphingobium sp.]MCP5385461.1 AAA family ATPase [Novosphingobium sp.]
MREEEFRQWLEANGANTPAGRNTRVHAVRTIEGKLSELGLNYSDLEQAWGTSRFTDVRDAITALRADFDAGGERFRILMPQSENPRNRLASWRSWLGQYGQFLDGGLATNDADRIRRHVLETYIEPARAKAHDVAELVVKDVNDALRLKEAWPNICQAMRGRKFHELADVPPPQSFGADMSTATRFRFDLDTENYWALAILRDRFGEPIARSAKMVSFKLPDGRQIALDLEAARTQLWFEGTIAAGDYPGSSVKHYDARTSRHSNLPSRLRHTGDDARDVSLITVPNGEILSQLLDEYANSSRLDRAALSRLKQAFLALHPDFVSFADCPSFATAEGGYKRALVAEAGRLVLQHVDQSDGDLGSALIELLAGRSTLECNLIDWRAQKVVDNAREANPGLIEAAAGRLARAENAVDGVAAFVETVWPVMRGDLPSNPYAESRMFPTMLRGLVDPQSVLPIRSTPTDNAARMLLGRPAFAYAPLTREELVNVTGMAREIMRIMDEEWHWGPRDLWDVQGFIWETCQKRLPEGNDMTDEQLLARFDGDEKFRLRRTTWSEEQSRAFCHMARAVHSQGLDWYHTNIPEIRFGRRELSALKADPTLGVLHLAGNALKFSHSSPQFSLSGAFILDDAGAEAFASAIAGAADQFQSSQTLKTGRQAYWPDDYTTAVAAEVRDRKPNRMQPTNLILYGPPGTGKTYRTMEEAVRYCGEIPAADRPSLRDQYERLRKEKRIEFVTFHQNFAYEEFVEGLRPQTGVNGAEGNSVGFDLKPKLGIFRNICQLAEAATEAAAGGKPIDLGGKRVFKMSLGRAGIEDQIFEDAIENGYAALGWGGDIDWSPYETYEAIHERWNQDHPGTNGNDANIIQTTRFRADMKEGDVIVVSHGNKLVRAIGVVAGPYRYEPDGTSEYSHRRKVDWLKVFREPIDYSAIYDVPFMQWSCYLLKEQHLNRSALANLLPGAGGPAEAPKQYVLVIDEINRANISKVFGELITLIEPDKRIGMDEQLKVRLPYSEDEFGVPANLHIIGTMNTADRSITPIDTALRRRFRFEELAPDTAVEAFQEAEHTTGLPLSTALTTMNRRIEYLVDRDHRIGHAFFIGCKDKNAVDAVMRDKVIPLLQEYFFDDWNRLAAVLGEKEKGGNFLECEIIEDPMGEGGEPLKSWRVRKDFDAEAYDRLAGRAVPSTPSSAEENEDE